MGEWHRAARVASQAAARWGPSGPLTERVLVGLAGGLSPHRRRGIRDCDPVARFLWIRQNEDTRGLSPRRRTPPACRARLGTASLTLRAAQKPLKALSVERHQEIGLVVVDHEARR